MTEHVFRLHDLDRLKGGVLKGTAQFSVNPKTRKRVTAALNGCGTGMSSGGREGWVYRLACKYIGVPVITWNRGQYYAPYSRGSPTARQTFLTYTFNVAMFHMSTAERAEITQAVEQGPFATLAKVGGAPWELYAPYSGFIRFIVPREAFPRRGFKKSAASTLRMWMNGTYPEELLECPEVMNLTLEDGGTWDYVR